MQEIECKSLVIITTTFLGFFPQLVNYLYPKFIVFSSRLLKSIWGYYHNILGFLFQICFQSELYHISLIPILLGFLTSVLWNKFLGAYIRRKTWKFLTAYVFTSIWGKKRSSYFKAFAKVATYVTSHCCLTQKSRHPYLVALKT
jgi:hypothetical protein